MSTGFESAISSFLEKNGVGNGIGTARAREYVPLGVNAQKVVSLRYALKDEHGNPLETWEDIDAASSAMLRGPRPSHSNKNSFTTR